MGGAIDTLEQIADDAMIEKGFTPAFPQQVLDEVAHMQGPARPPPIARDLRSLFWVSIDNDDSRDLDQLTYADKDHIFIAVADVDALVKKNGPTDRCAQHNTTSVYTPTKVFPMLPHKLSTDLTSLNPAVDRCALVTEMQIGPEGRFTLVDLYLAVVRNQAKLAYNRVARFLEENERLEGLSDEGHAQLVIQDGLAQKIRAFREKQGALAFETAALEALVVNGAAIRLEARQVNRAHRLIENYMIAANVGGTQFLEAGLLPTLRRIVKKPKRWERIVHLAQSVGGALPAKPDAKALNQFLRAQKEARPEHFHDLSLAIIKLIGRGEYAVGGPHAHNLEHFDLALTNYSHTTAPNRRYPDLIMQRLLKSHLFSTPMPYTHKELVSLAKHCTEKEQDAEKVERRLIKCAAAMVMVHQVGHRFEAMVTGSSPKGTWVRLNNPPVEGRLTHGHEELDVGDHVTVQLIRADVKHGHLDFSRFA